MIEITHVWEVSLSTIEPLKRRELQRKYGSKRSGTVYLIASNQYEAQEVARDLWKMVGLTPPEKPLVYQVHLVKNALRLIP